VSMLAELVARQNDRRGGPLRDAQGPIHLRAVPGAIPTATRAAACRVATPSS
jgi:hypothetical protein